MKANSSTFTPEVADSINAARVAGRAALARLSEEHGKSEAWTAIMTMVVDFMAHGDAKAGNRDAITAMMDFYEERRAAHEG